MFSQEFEAIRQSIENFARAECHQFITVEHLLLGLLDDEETRVVLIACQVDVVFLQNELKNYINHHVDKMSDDHEPEPTRAFERILRRAVLQVQSSGQSRPVTGVDVLVSLFKERDTQDAHIA